MNQTPLWLFAALLAGAGAGRAQPVDGAAASPDQAAARQDARDRRCMTGCARTEIVDGEVQPYSLPMKVAQYSAEAAARADQIDSQDAAVNRMLLKILELSRGRYDLSAYMLPTNIAVDPRSEATVRAVVDAQTIPNLGNELKRIAAEAGGRAPGPAVPDRKQIAVLALAAADALMPSSPGKFSADSVPVSFAIERYRYANLVAGAAREWMDRGH